MQAVSEHIESVNLGLHVLRNETAKMLAVIFNGNPSFLFRLIHRRQHFARTCVHLLRPNRWQCRPVLDVRRTTQVHCVGTRLAGGVDGYYRDVRRRARQPGSELPASGRTSPERERDARTRSNARGPPGWSDDRERLTETTRVYGRTDADESIQNRNVRDGVAETARRAVFGGGGGFGFGSESDRDFHDDFGEFKSEGEYDSEFE